MKVRLDYDWVNGVAFLFSKITSLEVLFIVANQNALVLSNYSLSQFKYLGMIAIKNNY